MKAKEEYVKVKKLYASINKKVIIVFWFVTSILFLLGLYFQAVLYVASIAFILGGYISLIIIKLNNNQILESFNEYYNEYRNGILLKTKVMIPKIIDRQISDNELKQLLGDKLDLQLTPLMEGAFEYKESLNALSKVNARKYDNNVSSTFFNGIVIKFKINSKIGDFIYTKKDKIINYKTSYIEYEQVNLINGNTLYVLDDNEYQDVVSYVNKLEMHFGEDSIILKIGEYLYIATKYKIELEKITQVSYQNFNESDFEAIVDEYIMLYELCSI